MPEVFRLLSRHLTLRQAKT